MDCIIKIFLNDNDLDIIFSDFNKKNIINTKKYDDKIIIIKTGNNNNRKNNEIIPLCLSYINKKNQIYRIYNKMNKEKYVKCWNCTLYITNIPIGIPYKIDITKTDNIPEEKSKIFFVNGYFCSFPCAYKYNYDIFNNAYENMLYILYEQYGYKGKMKMAPDKSIMIDYGGTISEEIYKQMLEEDNKVTYNKKIPPIMCMKPNILINTKNNNYIKYI